MFTGIKAFFKGIERKSDDGYEVLTGGALPTAAGVSVSPEAAMRCSVSFACIKVIAETIEQLTPHLYRRKGDDRERATDHPLSALVTKAANDWTPASEFRLVLGTHFATHGNAYAFVNRDAAGRVVELIPLDPRTVSVRQDPRTMAPVYMVATGNPALPAREYDRSEILHIRGVGLDVHKGASPVTLGREAIGLSLTLEHHCGSLFGNGAKPSGMLKVKGRLTEDQFRRVRSMFSNFYQGVTGKRTMILSEDMDFQQVQLNSVDAQTLEMRRFQVEEVSRFWRVPLHLVNEMDRATHANAESMGQQFLTFCMLPILRLWCDAMAITLLTPEERETLYFEFLVDDLARADIAARFTAMSSAISAGILNPNEARAMENRPPYAGGETFMRPVNTAPAPTTERTHA
ncbi:phage portal protein [Azospirillum doebereinerae]|uniref:Phage portal protein n=1 Tax=Azospirillum doebereinerae TaxID=92933 RepID=A0A3S0XDN4_9PROT|nr:phage portal protein [Azospirillum doebereinerae]RUQ75070.1 phage portal protein [Azospirillum doebereinerae]